MNLANRLTASRLALTVLLVVLLLGRPPFGDTAALVLFIAAAVTDFFDGRIARDRGQITAFGVLMDPLVDKVLVCAVFIALVERGRLDTQWPVQVHAWMAIVVVVRELAITGLRLLAASRQLVLAAERYGKHKTSSQMVAVVALLLLLATREWPEGLAGLFRPWLPVVAWGLLWVAVVLTLWSGALYLWRNRQLYLEQI
ncbi:CDP-diacylglycerol--glycerol-3-phosphate 3-phosphatidyltransferase [Limisphaera ngatamarikiensis]|uniref:CDP-diacylglycerol--glycerol-3-phosphate 3-phosphatidyltransferase n=1 Tax=Limisphaera ngatamarikiensis TaxID=1324935 RepID=A0A6M1RYA3_9BACT|nr:CDP-diacylglycerol--glycerol-3-phosphate 3-phosphatidyltransferase [Limisphaera ngatamarikiensis]NGO39732.1 CDP-diacylglycerol--glycerol-3-phosphate 3-phosphatidyltransferase [Limisphaera ngatamarikiensis]